MIKIVVGGAIDKQNIAKIIEGIGGKDVKVEIKSDIEAAMAVKTGTADYYFGACNTGGGGALAMAIALLGAGKCATLSMPGKAPEEEKVIEAINKGKVAFGFTNEHINQAVPMILKLIINK
ncbi:DUF2620 domain-containing protein [Maledivibacter halophilus]|uniref:DUF2620 domain-containing protein n=1 Tax=Maledivibacter halophilus TaxID=36842 RepID=A0A1T5M1J6_9FIRM|nr:DUF2620 domain-containing protein [Maledivibacter halophilus]SKC81729.1 Protein of unknown function DUF2620 [Maledivibacter halophilus]